MNSSNHLSPDARAPKKNSLWPAAIVAAFVVFIAGMTAWIIFATRNDLDLVQRDYYEQEMVYQRRIDAIDRTRQFAAGVSISYESASQTFSLRLPSEHAASLTEGRVQFYRPSDARLDQQVALRPSREGFQNVSAAGLAAGAWKVRLYWQAKGEEFFYEKPVVIPRS